MALGGSGRAGGPAHRQVDRGPIGRRLIGRGQIGRAVVSAALILGLLGLSAAVLRAQAPVIPASSAQSPTQSPPSAKTPRPRGAAGGAAGDEAPKLTTLPLAEARAGLRQALAHGQTDLAHDLALAMTRAMPGDFPAQAALTESLIRLQRPQAAVAGARRAQGLARSAPQSFEADLLRARASGLSGGALDGVVAGYWARRAVARAPQEGYRLLATSEAQRLRQAAPLALQLALSASPSSNVNNGSREREVILPGWGGLTWALSPQSRALKGWIGEVSLAGRYRLAESETQARSLSFALYHRAVRLSAGAKGAIRDWQAAQAAAGQPVPEMPRYDHSVIEAGLSEMRQWGRGLWTLKGTAGHSWFARRDLNDYLRLETGVERPLAKGSFSLGVTLEKQWGRAGNFEDAFSLGLDAGQTHALAQGDQLRLAGNLRQTESDSLDQRHRAVGLRLSWKKAAPLAGMRLEASLGAEARRYDPSILSVEGRRDTRLDAVLSLGAEKLEYMGFAPLLNLSLGRVNSNVRIYEGTSSGISLKLRSVF